MTTARPGCLSARASRPSQVSACIVNRLRPLWGIHVTDFWDDGVSLRAWEGQKGWAIMGVCLTSNELECVTDLHFNLVKKKSQHRTPGDPLFYSQLQLCRCYVLCVCVYVLFLMVSHTPSAAEPWHRSTPSASYWDHLHIPRMSTNWPIWTAGSLVCLP